MDQESVIMKVIINQTEYAPALCQNYLVGSEPTRHPWPEQNVGMKWTDMDSVSFAYLVHVVFGKSD